MITQWIEERKKLVGPIDTDLKQIKIRAEAALPNDEAFLSYQVFDVLNKLKAKHVAMEQSLPKALEMLELAIDRLASISCNCCYTADDCQATLKEIEEIVKE